MQGIMHEKNILQRGAFQAHCYVLKWIWAFDINNSAILSVIEESRKHLKKVSVL